MSFDDLLHVISQALANLLGFFLSLIVFNRKEGMQVLNSLWETYCFVEFRVVGVEIEVVRFGVGFFDGQRELGLD